MNQIPRGSEDHICPMHRKAMSKVCHKCPWWTKVVGRNPNDGQQVDKWNCAIAWLPMLSVNTAQEARQGAAATESFRNEMVRRADAQAPRPLQRVRDLALIESD